MPDPQPPVEPGGRAGGRRRPRGRLAGALAILLAVAALGGAVGALGALPVTAPSSDLGSASPSPSGDPVEQISALLDERARAVSTGDRVAFLAQVDNTQTDFAAAQSLVIDRLAEVAFASWAYVSDGTGPPLPPARAAVLPAGSRIVAAHLRYRLEGTGTEVERAHFLTVVPREGRWLIAGDADAAVERTERDLWDIGAVHVLRGRSSVVVADRRGATRAEARQLAEVADLAVRDVGRLWTQEWSRRPLVMLPRTQQDMATLLDHEGSGLAQIAAVTTGTVDAAGRSRGDRVVVNPAAFAVLGAVGRRVVLSHEMTHVATRTVTVTAPPVWLSEGFADYVAYDATPLPTPVVAADVLDRVREGRAPRRLPGAADFDAGAGDIASAYESSWLACRMITERYGEDALVRLYGALVDGAGPGWPAETETVLGVSARQLTRQWRAYLAEEAAA